MGRTSHDKVGGHTPILAVLFNVLASPLAKLYVRMSIEWYSDRPSRKKGAIFAANHASWSDPWLLGYAIPRLYTAFLAKSEFFKNPVSRWFFLALGQIPVDRSGGEGSLSAKTSARFALKCSQWVGIFAEGGSAKCRERHVHRGKTFVIRLALATGAPVYAVGLTGTADVLPPGKWLWRPRKVRVRFQEFSLDGCDPNDEAQIHAKTEELMRIIANLSEQPYCDIKLRDCINQHKHQRQP